MNRMKSKQLKITENLNINNHRIINTSNPIDNNDAVNKKYVDDNNILLSGGTINGNVYANNLSGENTGDQFGDGISIVGSGTITDPFVSVVGTPGLLPTYTTSQRLLLTPLNGQMVLDTDYNQLFIYINNSWEIN